jgi:hypothetical protein
VLRLERHPLGPRIYLCGLRIHEFALGLGVLAILLAGGCAELWELTRRTEVAGVLGVWLIGKDWRDLFPSKRNTASWSVLPHRVPRD